MVQTNIFAAPSKMDEAFWRCADLNPQVLDRLIEMTEQAKRAGKTKIGMKMLFEVIRWEHLVHTRGDDFALNNNFTSRYVRILSDKRPDLADMFETRRIRS